MIDAPASDGESSKPNPASEVQQDLVIPCRSSNTRAPREDYDEIANLQDRRPFGSLQFQVSEVVGRLEAGVNAQDAMEEDRKRETRKISAGFFEPEEMGMDDILKVLEDLVLKTDPSCESVEPPLLPTDAVTRAAILSHSISALFGRLERSHAARLGAHIASETTRWMAHMFRLPDYHAYYHQEQMEGIVRVTKMLLHHKYPRYLEDGGLALVARPPCIYSGASSEVSVVQHLCRQLALPLACVRPVPARPDGRGVDAGALARLCAEDGAAGRVPLLVLGCAGAPPLGAGDDLRALAAVCRPQRLHLHLRGHALALPAAAPAAPAAPAACPDQSFSVADSLTITPGPWFGVPGLPAVTFYRIPEPVVANDISKSDETAGGAEGGAGAGRAGGAGAGLAGRAGALAALGGLTGGGARLPALPLWTCGLAAGGPRLAARVARALGAARHLRAALRAAAADHPLRLLSGPPGGDELPNVDIIDAVSAASACVVFQYVPPAPAAAGGQRPPPYYDKLNSWLGQVLQREADLVGLEVCDTEAHGVVLRYCPLEGAGAAAGADPPAGAALAAALEAQLQVLDATVRLRESFEQRVQAEGSLRLVRLAGWAGLGGVRLVPPGWEGAPAEELNALNRQLVEALKVTDGAFSCGDGDDGLVCVRFGMVTADTDVAELVRLLLAAAGPLADGSRALARMAAVLKKGIEVAEAALAQEAAERAWADGLLRRVPVVGRVVTWWAPPPPPPPGRSLHLRRGTLTPTTDVYRMVQEHKEQAAAPCEPPPPPPPPLAGSDPATELN